MEAYDFVIDEITYNFTKEHGTVEVSGLREFLNLEPGDRNSSLPLVVNIPPVVTYKDNKYDVVSIGYAAFQGCRKVTEIKYHRQFERLENLLLKIVPNLKLSTYLIP